MLTCRTSRNRRGASPLQHMPRSLFSMSVDVLCCLHKSHCQAELYVTILHAASQIGSRKAEGSIEIGVAAQVGLWICSWQNLAPIAYEHSRRSLYLL